MEKQKPHAVVLPTPGPGHINPMMKLAKVLHSRGFYITFVNAEIVQRVWLRFQGRQVLDRCPTFRFLTTPSKLSESDEHKLSGSPFWMKATANDNHEAHFRELVSRIASGSDGFPPISCIVADSFKTFALDVAQELGVPSALLFTFNACSAMAYAHLHQLIEKGFAQSRDSFLTDGYGDTVIDWVPGMEGIKLRYMPSYFRITDADDILIQLTIDQMERAHKATIIIINTFQAVEANMIDEIKCMYPQLYSAGPLHLLENQLAKDEFNFAGPTLFKEEDGYLKWLDSKEPGSVIVVAFGSMSYITAPQLMEFAWGLANSKQNFLWIIRPDLVLGEAAVIPPEFEMEIKDRGLITSWCNQEHVLKHSAIGGFLTHCGWNSVLESVCAGVPMIFWPLFSDQAVNCWLCCKHLGIGLELDSEVKRENVESLVRELMVGEKGKQMKAKVMEWKRLAETACSISGSSYENLEKVIEVLQSKP